MNVFDILGPVMVGPSSSHTAGAARIGRTAMLLLGERPVRAEVLLHGSFAATGRGHGTDRALVAGLLGMLPDDARLPQSFEIAQEQGLRFTIGPTAIRGAHPNTALLRLQGGTGRRVQVQASSVGGGRIRVTQIDGLEASFTGELPTLVVHNADAPGHVARVTGLLAQAGLNVATMQLCRDHRGGYAVMVIEVDQQVGEAVAQPLRAMPGIVAVTYLNPDA